MTTFSTAWANALSAQHSAFGESVTYARGAASVVVNAIEVADNELVVGEPSMVMRFGRSSFIIASADLVLSGSAALPQRGDTITLSGGSVYEVQEPGGESWVYRLEDPQGVWIRVYAVRRTT